MIFTTICTNIAYLSGLYKRLPYLLASLWNTKVVHAVFRKYQPCCKQKESFEKTRRKQNLRDGYHPGHIFNFSQQVLMKFARRWGLSYTKTATIVVRRQHKLVQEIFSTYFQTMSRLHKRKMNLFSIESLQEQYLLIWFYFVVAYLLNKNDFFII